MGCLEHPQASLDLDSTPASTATPTDSVAALTMPECLEVTAMRGLIKGDRGVRSNKGGRTRGEREK